MIPSLSHRPDPIAPFTTLEEEAQFWATHNLTDFTRLDTGELDDTAREVIRLHGTIDTWKRIQ
jgi:hypothetical protein